MNESIAEPATDAPPIVEAPSDASLPTDAHRRRWLLPVLITPVVLAVLLVAAWAVDTSLGGVPRNVRLAGTDISRLSEDALTSRVAAAATAFSATPVEIVAGDATYRTTADEIGLMVDETHTIASALDVGSHGFVPLRPLGWVRSFVSPRQAPLEFQVSHEQVAATTIELEGDSRIPPTEPVVSVEDGALRVSAGIDGLGIDPTRVADALPRAARSAEEDGPIRIHVDQGPIPPLASAKAARSAVSAAETRVNEPIEIRTDEGSRTIEATTLRGWLALVTHPDGTVSADLDPTRVSEGLRAAFADIDGHPVDASFTVDGGVPIIRPDRPGKICCTDNAAITIDTALHARQDTVTLALLDGPAAFTVADAQEWGITQAVGGNHAWRNGAPTTADAGFTTYHSATGARVINIHRIADLVRGAVIPPGGSFSVNEHVGKRTIAKGFVTAGAIANGEHVDEIGGGISQFATTTFNAAFFAGLDIDDYQAHSEYFDRYPRGREATMGHPSPDLKFTNNTPYGILIWPTYTSTSLTVTLYSTPYATADQTAITEGTSGNCRIVTTTRTRTFPDGRSDTDKFRARYRPGPGQGC